MPKQLQSSLRRWSVLTQMLNWQEWRIPWIGQVFRTPSKLRPTSHILGHDSQFKYRYLAYLGLHSLVRNLQRLQLSKDLR
jgi:hypothetical protein